MLISLWRTFFLFLFVSLCLRFMGKRQIGELQPSELATTIMISNIAAIPIENIGSPILNGLLAIALLACLEVIISIITLKSRLVRGIMLGHPRCIIRDGKVDQNEMRALRWSIDDLTELLRANGIFDIDEVLLAIVETNGSLSAYQKHKFRPVNNEGLKIPLNGSEMPPVVIISDGEADKNALDYCNLDEAWLDKTLKSESVKLKDVFFMSCDRSAKYRLVRKGD